MKGIGKVIMRENVMGDRYLECYSREPRAEKYLPY
jgi:hypothetical protein